MRFGLVSGFGFDFWFDWGRHRRSSLTIPHTLQITASAPKVASRFRHLWFIFLIWKYWVSAVSVFGYSVLLWLHCFRLLRFAFVALSRACFMRFCLVSVSVLVSGLIGAATAAPGNIA
jgi:hypothetical protein